MHTFIFNSIFWVLAIYGLIEIIKSVIYIFSYTKQKANGIYIIIAVKNEENKIEGFLRTLLFRIIYGKEDIINKLVVADLGSNDETSKIIKKIEQDYKGTVKAVNWKECKNIIDNISNT